MAGNELVRRHFRTLHRFFRGKVSQGIDDLMQRTFLVAVEGREKIYDESGFRAFLLGIARRQVLQHYRQQKKAQRSDPLESGVADVGVSPSGVVNLREEQGILLRALRQLPLDFQIAVELYYWERMKTAEIAIVLEIAPGTVKSRLARARDMLRDNIARMNLSAELLESTVGDLEGWAASLRDSLEDPENSD